MRLFGLMIQQSTGSFKGGFYGIQTLLIWDVKTIAYSRLDPHTSQIGLVTTLKTACRLRTLVCGGRPQFDTQYFGQLWNIFSGEKNISHGKKKTQYYITGGERLWEGMSLRVCLLMCCLLVCVSLSVCLLKCVSWCKWIRIYTVRIKSLRL